MFRVFCVIVAGRMEEEGDDIQIVLLQPHTEWSNNIHQYVTILITLTSNEGGCSESEDTDEDSQMWVDEWDFIVMFYSDLMGLLIEICRGVSVSCSSSV